MTRKRLERIERREKEIKKRFTSGMHSRGLTPIPNPGTGNCVFTSLASLIFGDATKHQLMRYMIVHRLRSFPNKYHRNSAYINSMAVSGNPASPKEL